MSGRKRIVASVVVALVIAVAGIQAVKTAPAGKSFSSLQPGFTQELFAATTSFLVRNTGYLGGITVLPGGDVVAAECLFSGTRLHRFSATATVVQHGTALHVETLLPSGGGCGLVYHPDGTLYLNTKTTGLGITNVNPGTGAIIRKIAAPTGNAVGIAVDPVTHHIVYTGSNCAVNTACTLYDLDPATGVVATFAQFTSEVAYVNGIYFDPTGAFLFLDNRTPTNRLTIVNRAGGIVQHVAMPSSASQPVGIGFAATSPKFIVTNNTDGTMQRFDFPNDDFSQVPTRTVFASGGYRGDLMQAGPDGCLYVTQGGARYDNNDVQDGSIANSIVRICGSPGFVPPDGVPTWPPRVPMGTLHGTVTDSVSHVPLSLATVLVSAAGARNISTMTDPAGGYSFQLSPATYDVTVSAPDYSPTTIAGIVLADLDDIVTNVALMPLPGTLTGVVRNVAGTAVVSATVLLSNGKSSSTDSTGGYAINSIVPGNYDATVTAPFYDTLTVTRIAVPINATATQNFTLTQTPGTLQGVVTDTAGTPVPGAKVTLTGGAVAVADAAGAYVFAAVTPGIYTATVSAATYYTLTVSGVTIPNAGSTTKDFKLSPMPGTLRGIVTNVPGAVLQNAKVTLSSGAYDWTDSYGRYSIGSITPGTYGVTVTMSNYDSFSAAGIIIPNAATVDYPITLTQTPGTIQGVVTDTAAKPLSGATVVLSNGMSATTDTTGNYAILNVIPGTYGATVSAATYNTLAASGIVVLNASTTTKSFALTPTPGALQGVVTNAAGAPIASATVKLSNGRSAGTNAAGQYLLSSVPPGTYSATVTASNYDMQTSSGIVIPNATTVTLDLTMAQTPGKLQGTVNNAAGAALASATVLLSNGASATTDATGNYVIAGLMPASYNATVTAFDYNVLTASAIVIPNAGTVTRNFTLTQTPGTLQGTVADSAGLPIAGAKVLLSNNASALTNASGAYAFTSVSPGTYSATVSAATFNTLIAAGIVIANAGSTTRNFTLTPTPGTLQGVVTDTAGAKLVGATVTLSTAAAPNVASASTDVNGAYVFASVAPNTYSVTAAAATYIAQASTGVVMPNAGAITLNFSLAPQPGRLQGVVIDTAGAKVGGATVLLSNGASTVTDAAGAYAFAAVTPGTYGATVSASTYNTLTAAGIVVANAGSTTRDFTLTPLPGTLQGVVSDPAGAPIAGATVLLSSGTSAITDAAGAYVFASLTPGTYGATVSATSYNPFAASGIVVPNAGTTSRNFTLTPLPGALQGVVTNTAGTPIASATVQLAGGTSVVTDTGGRYTFGSLTPGTYAASVSAANYDTLSASGIAIPIAATATYNFTLTQTPGTLQGTVKNAAGTVIAGATVQLVNGPAVVTDAAGRYLFPTVMPGTYAASVVASNYNGLTVSGIVMPNAGAVTRDFTLTQTPGTLQGVVYDTTGAKLTGAKVLLSNGVSVLTSTTGSYTIASLAPATYGATVSASTYSDLAVTGLVIANGTTVIRDFTLTPLPGTIQGVVTDAANVKLAGATVTLSNGASTVTGATGAYAFASLTPGTYSITASAPTYIAQTAAAIVVPNAGSVTRNFALAPVPGSLQGVVSSAAGGVVASAKVVLSNGATATADATGKYVFATVPPGVYGATVSAANYTDTTAAGIVIGNASSVTQNFTLTPIDPCKAANAYFALGPANTYALLGIDIAGCGYTTMDIEGKTTTIGGDLGIGASVDAYLEAATIQGDLDTDPGSWVTRKNTLVVQGVSAKVSLAAAASAIASASARMAKLTPTQKLAAVSNSITIKGKGGVNVVSIPTLKIVGGAVTIQGGASDIFVFNVAGKFELDASKVVLTGGVRACNILWNFTGTNISEPNEVELENGATGAGIFLSPSRLVEVLDSTHTGRVLAGGDITVYSSTIKPQ